MLPYLNPKLHLFLVPEDDVDTAPTAETTEHPHPPPSSQEDETTSSSERTSVSAALEQSLCTNGRMGLTSPFCPLIHALCPSRMGSEYQLGS